MTSPAQNNPFSGPDQGTRLKGSRARAPAHESTAEPRRVIWLEEKRQGHLVLQLLESLDELPRVVAGDRQVEELDATLQVAYLAREDRVEGFPVDRVRIGPAPGAPFAHSLAAAAAPWVQRQAGWAAGTPANGQAAAHALGALGRGSCVLVRFDWCVRG